MREKRAIARRVAGPLLLGMVIFTVIPAAHAGIDVTVDAETVGRVLTTLTPKQVTLEMLGRPEPRKSSYAWITGAALSDLAEIAKPALEEAGVDLVDFAMAPRLFFASDNLPFAQRGVVAHSISAGLDYAKGLTAMERAKGTLLDARGLSLGE